jgi:hypothetical protein
MEALNATFKHYPITGGGGNVGYAVSSTLTKSQFETRTQIFQGIKINLDGLRRDLQLAQLDNVDGVAAFHWVLFSLHCYFIAFHPYDCLTSTTFRSECRLRSWGSPYVRQNLLKRLYMQELQIINRWLFLDRRCQDLFFVLRKEKVQQFLRGAATMRMVNLLPYHKSYRPLKFKPSTIKTIGTLVYPVYGLDTLSRLIDRVSHGEMTTAEFQENILRLPEDLVMWREAFSGC